MRILLVLTVLVSTACTHAAPAPIYTACRTPIPLELRLKRIERRLAEAYAHAPPLTAAEHAETSRLAACVGGAVLGVGTGCPDEIKAARASGLFDRNGIRGAVFSVPEYVARAMKQPLGGERTNNLITAMHIAEESEDALRAHLAKALTQAQRDDIARGVMYVDEPPEVRAYQNDPLKLFLVSADIQQALICDAEDQAMGRKTGLPFDPDAPVPDGP